MTKIWAETSCPTTPHMLPPTISSLPCGLAIHIESLDFCGEHLPNKPKVLGDIKNLSISIDTEGPFAQTGSGISFIIRFSIQFLKNVKKFHFVKRRE